MTNWKRLDSWTDYSVFMGYRVRRMNNEELNRPDITDTEGIVIGYDAFGVKIDTPWFYEGQSWPGHYMTTPWHSNSKWYVDIESLPEGFESDYILEDDPPHPEHHSQDEWSPNPALNKSVSDNYHPPKE